MAASQPTTLTTPPVWLAPSALLLALAGIGVSIYLTIAHYTTPTILACPDTGLINCAKVTTSSYSVLLGIPLPLLGLAFFISQLPLNLPAAWRSSNQLLRRLRLLISATGVLMVFYLVYTELFRLNAICLFCTAVHVLTILLFILTAMGTALTAPIAPNPAPKPQTQP